MALELSPDIILLDTSLEDKGSYEVISYLCKHPVTIDIPIVVTTSMDISRGDERALMESHVHKVIRKDRDVREQLLSEMFRLEKLNPERARLLDPQTKLFNRRYFDKRLTEELKRAERYSLDLSALLIHLDQPAPTSPDFLEALLGLAGLLRGNLRAADPLARFDEGSFAVLLPETHRQAGYEAANKIVALARSAKLQNQQSEDIKVTVSVAVAGCDRCQTTLDAIITRLQETLAEIQKRGGDAAQLE
jgi:diguanylate cyclase (GGDEF)-like protein